MMCSSTNELKGKEKEKLIKRNNLFFILSKLDITAMVIPVIVKVWELANLSFAQMLLLQGIFALSIMIFEIPSGAFSDMFKRKLVLVTGYSILTVACFLYFIGRSFTAYALAEALFGVGGAVISGSDVSLVYDGLIEINETERYKQILSKATTLSFLTAMISLPISGLIALHNIYTPLLIISISFGFKAVMFLFVYEPERKKAESINGATVKSIKLLIHSKFLISIFIATFSLSVFGRAVFWSYQPKLFALNISTFEIGLIFATMNLIAALSSTIMGKVKQKFELLAVYAFLVIETISYLVIWKLHSLLILTAIYALQITRGGRAPIISQMIQRKLSSDLRATFTSFISAITNLAFFIYSLLLNFYNVTIDTTVFSAMIGATLLLPFFFILNNFKLNNNELNYTLQVLK
ncbi:MAG: MFS transporter [Candidatus Heimdallarchaeaceae archaeon]|nr:MAG: hypothetical protein DRN69_03075 [Candidatus Pacearchaeota archaeon]